MAYCITSRPEQSPGVLIRDGFVLILRGIVLWLDMGRQAMRDADARRDLQEMDDRMLHDIGLRRDDIRTLFKR